MKLTLCFHIVCVQLEIHAYENLCDVFTKPEFASSMLKILSFTADFRPTACSVQREEVFYANFPWN